MPNLLSRSRNRLLKALTRVRDTQPVKLSRCALLSGDGVSAGISWSWAGSWDGTMSPLGREAWFTQTREAGTVTRRNFVVMVPLTAGVDWNDLPQVDERIELLNPDGESMGVYIVNFVLPHMGDDVMVKWEANVELAQP